MKILIVNSSCGIGSVGKICVNIAQRYEEQGYEVKITYGRDRVVPDEYRKYAVRIGNSFDLAMHLIHSRLFDRHGFASKIATMKFVRWLDEFKPDVIWLHNLHGYYLHIGVLFRWIKEHPEIKIKWTLHDCWTFTGHCAHFATEGCNKWKSECGKCPLLRKYPKSLLVDSSKKNYWEKKALFTDINDLEIFVPSHWLKSLVSNSFLAQYPIYVLPNEVDTNVFKKNEGTFRMQYGLEDKIVLLGVAYKWTRYKGLDTFIELEKLIDDNYRIVLVGLDEKQIKNMPPKIIGITRTSGTEELVQMYSSADIFINPSTEETYGMTTAEAIACGTKAIVYKGTACEEVVSNHANCKAVEIGAGNILQAIAEMLEVE